MLSRTLVQKQRLFLHPDLGCQRDLAGCLQHGSAGDAQLSAVVLEYFIQQRQDQGRNSLCLMEKHNGVHEVDDEYAFTQRHDASNQ
jgi:hypothetical protein